MENLGISVGLKTPVLLHRQSWLTFDSLICSLLVNQQGLSFECACRQMPIAYTDSGIPHASAVFFRRIQEQCTFTIARILKLRERMDGRFAFPVGRGGRESTFINLGNDKTAKSILNTYNRIDAESAHWFCRGDRQQIQELLQGLRYLGKKGGAGHGWISDAPVIQVLPDDCSIALPRATSRGQIFYPMRPVPEALWPYPKSPGTELAHTISRLPYHRGAPDLCVVPSSKRHPFD